MAFPIRIYCPNWETCRSMALTGRTDNVVWIECLVCGFYDWAEIERGVVDN